MTEAAVAFYLAADGKFRYLIFIKGKLIESGIADSEEMTRFLVNTIYSVNLVSLEGDGKA